jgi:hypothetical protein
MIVTVAYANAAEILISMGWKIDADFVSYYKTPSSCDVDWLSVSPMPTAGEIDAAAPTAAANIIKAIAQKAKTAAASGIDAGAAVVGDKTERLVRALMEVILDEFNLHALKHNAILDSADAATSFADFKARMVLVPDYPARTAAQLVNAIKTKIAASAE